jgi:hypothetical protein
MSGLRSFLRRFRGFSVSALGFGGGVSFVPPDDDRRVIRELLDRLGDRRVLFDKACGKDRAEMIASIQAIRTVISEKTLPALTDDAKARPLLRSMREACHEFQNFLEGKLPEGDYGRYPYQKNGLGGPEEDFYVAVGEWRALIGPTLAELCELYQIDLEQDYPEFPSPKQPPRQFVQQSKSGETEAEPDATPGPASVSGSASA